MFGRVLGQHHDAAHTGMAARFRIPVRLLIGDRRDELPRKPRLSRRVAHRLLVVGQHFLDRRAEGADIDIVEGRQETEEAARDIEQEPGLALLGHPALEIIREVLRTRRHEPGDRLIARQFERLDEFGIVGIVDLKLRRVGDRAVEAALRHIFEKRLDRFRRLADEDAGRLRGEQFDGIGARRAGGDGDLEPCEVGGLLRHPYIATADDELAYRLMRRRGGEARLAILGRNKAGGGELALALGESLEEFGLGVVGPVLDLDAERPAERLRHLVIEAGLAFRAEIVGRRREPRQDDETPALADRLEPLRHRRNVNKEPQRDRHGESEERRHHEIGRARIAPGRQQAADDTPRPFHGFSQDL